ncbi:hypothetical protein ACMGD3_07425 [Lysinibacillus sphaericus]|uniref:hypothetical protein n=1 Tax=Lysinibacillus sphaericus TaxID=1421 RepID=UPI003F78FA32
MNEIQPLMLDLVQQFSSDMVASAKVTIDGVEYNKEIYQTSTKHGLRKYVKLSLEQGLVTRASLIDRYGRELYVKTLNYQKGAQGYVIAFPLQLEAKEVKVNA